MLWYGWCGDGGAGGDGEELRMVLECVGGGFSGLKPLGTSGPENTLENIFLHLFQGDEFYVLPGPFFRTGTKLFRSFVHLT